MRIKEFAKKYNMSQDGIRYYEKIGLLTPKRSENGYRHYDQHNEVVLQTIVVLKQLGFTLNEIQQLLNLQQQSISKECNLITTSFMKQKISEVSAHIDFYKQAEQILLYVVQLMDENKYAENKEVIQQMILDMYQKIADRGDHI